MKSHLFTHRILALWLSLSLVAPNSAWALRPSNAGMEENPAHQALRQQLQDRSAIRVEEWKGPTLLRMPSGLHPKDRVVIYGLENLRIRVGYNNKQLSFSVRDSMDRVSETVVILGEREIAELLEPALGQIEFRKIWPADKIWTQRKEWPDLSNADFLQALKNPGFLKAVAQRKKERISFNPERTLPANHRRFVILFDASGDDPSRWNPVAGVVVRSAHFPGIELNLYVPSRAALTTSILKNRRLSEKTGTQGPAAGLEEVTLEVQLLGKYEPLSTDTFTVHEIAPASRAALAEALGFSSDKPLYLIHTFGNPGFEQTELQHLSVTDNETRIVSLQEVPAFMLGNYLHSQGMVAEGRGDTPVLFQKIDRTEWFEMGKIARLSAPSPKDFEAGKSVTLHLQLAAGMEEPRELILERLDNLRPKEIISVTRYWLVNGDEWVPLQFSFKDPTGDVWEADPGYPEVESGPVADTEIAWYARDGSGGYVASRTYRIPVETLRDWVLDAGEIRGFYFRYPRLMHQLMEEVLPEIVEAKLLDGGQRALTIMVDTPHIEELMSYMLAVVRAFARNPEWGSLNGDDRWTIRFHVVTLERSGAIQLLQEWSSEAFHSAMIAVTGQETMWTLPDALRDPKAVQIRAGNIILPRFLRTADLVIATDPRQNTSVRERLLREAEAAGSWAVLLGELPGVDGLEGRWIDVGETFSPLPIYIIRPDAAGLEEWKWEDWVTPSTFSEPLAEQVVEFLQRVNPTLQQALVRDRPLSEDGVFFNLFDGDNSPEWIYPRCCTPASDLAALILKGKFPAGVGIFTSLGRIVAAPYAWVTERRPAGHRHQWVILRINGEAYYVSLTDGLFGWNADPERCQLYAQAIRQPWWEQFREAFVDFYRQQGFDRAVVLPWNRVKKYVRPFYVRPLGDDGEMPQEVPLENHDAAVLAQAIGSRWGYLDDELLELVFKGLASLELETGRDFLEAAVAEMFTQGGEWTAALSLPAETAEAIRHVLTQGQPPKLPGYIRRIGAAWQGNQFDEVEAILSAMTAETGETASDLEEGQDGLIQQATALRQEFENVEREIYGEQSAVHWKLSKPLGRLIEGLQQGNRQIVRDQLSVFRLAETAFLRPLSDPASQRYVSSTQDLRQRLSSLLSRVAFKESASAAGMEETLEAYVLAEVLKLHPELKGLPPEKVQRLAAAASIPNVKGIVSDVVSGNPHRAAGNILKVVSRARVEWKQHQDKKAAADAERERQRLAGQQKEQEARRITLQHAPEVNGWNEEVERVVREVATNPEQGGMILRLQGHFRPNDAHQGLRFLDKIVDEGVPANRILLVNESTVPSIWDLQTIVPLSQDFTTVLNSEFWKDGQLQQRIHDYYVQGGRPPLPLATLIPDAGLRAAFERFYAGVLPTGERLMRAAAQHPTPADEFNSVLVHGEARRNSGQGIPWRLESVPLVAWIIRNCAYYADVQAMEALYSFGEERKFQDWRQWDEDFFSWYNWERDVVFAELLRQLIHEFGRKGFLIVVIRGALHDDLDDYLGDYGGLSHAVSRGIGGLDPIIELGYRRWKEGRSGQPYGPDELPTVRKYGIYTLIDDLLRRSKRIPDSETLILAHRALLDPLPDAAVTELNRQVHLLTQRPDLGWYTQMRPNERALPNAFFMVAWLNDRGLAPPDFIHFLPHLADFHLANWTDRLIQGVRAGLEEAEEAIKIFESPEQPLSKRIEAAGIVYHSLFGPMDSAYPLRHARVMGLLRTPEAQRLFREALVVPDLELNNRVFAAYAVIFHGDPAVLPELRNAVEGAIISGTAEGLAARVRIAGYLRHLRYTTHDQVVGAQGAIQNLLAEIQLAGEMSRIAPDEADAYVERLSVYARDMQLLHIRRVNLEQTLLAPDVDGQERAEAAEALGESFNPYAIPALLEARRRYQEPSSENLGFLMELPWALVTVAIPGMGMDYEHSDDAVYGWDIPAWQSQAVDRVERLARHENSLIRQSAQDAWNHIPDSYKRRSSEGSTGLEEKGIHAEGLKALSDYLTRPDVAGTIGLLAESGKIGDLTEDFPDLAALIKGAGFPLGIAEIVPNGTLVDAALGLPEDYSVRGIPVFVEQRWEGTVRENLRGLAGSVRYVERPADAFLVIGGTDSMSVRPGQVFIGVDEETVFQVTPRLLAGLEERGLLKAGSVVMLYKSPKDSSLIFA